MQIGKWPLLLFIKGKCNCIVYAIQSKLLTIQLLIIDVDQFFPCPLQMESYLEARLWNDIFVWCQDKVSIRIGTSRFSNTWGFVLKIYCRFYITIFYYWCDWYLNQLQISVAPFSYCHHLIKFNLIIKRRLSLFLSARLSSGNDQSLCADWECASQLWDGGNPVRAAG